MLILPPCRNYGLSQRPFQNLWGDFRPMTGLHSEAALDGGTSTVRSSASCLGRSEDGRCHIWACVPLSLCGVRWGQVYSGASGIGWWGPGWKLGTCGLLEAQRLHGERVNQQAQASSGSMCSPH